MMRTMSQVSKLAVAMLGIAILLAPALAEARAGGGSSMGSRGGRTFQSAPATPTAPASKPIERSVTPPASPQKPITSPAVAPVNPMPGAQSSFFGRHPFVSGLMGGLVGAGIAGMLFGGGFGAGLGGMAGGLGLLLQLALIGGLIYFGLRLFRGRQQSAFAGAGGERQGEMRRIYEPANPGGGNGADRTEPSRLYEPARAAGASAPAGDAAPDLTKQDFDEFERVLVAVEAGWTAGDLAALRRTVTPEMLSYFSEQLAANVSRGIENHVEDVKLVKGDLSEHWSEGAIDYATVAMRWSARDYSVEAASGRVVEGKRDAATEATEIWTFMRTAGGRWLLSAIQQV
jgi:predicted lipid-binding transport protein (Tim44 family)